VILGAVYMLTVYKATMFGQLDEAKNGDLTDVSKRELATFIPLFLLVFIMGIYPSFFLKPIEPAINEYVQSVTAKKLVIGKSDLSSSVIQAASKSVAM
jgi:NADH-quinone oxidoreductase subunit M